MCPCPKIGQDLCDIYQTTIYKSPGEDLLLEADIGNIKVNASTRIAQYQEPLLVEICAQKGTASSYVIKSLDLV